MMNDPLVHDAVQKIVRYYSPDRILLFGSYAKGEQRQFSDIDLLIVKDTALPWGQRGHELRQLFYDSLVRVDLLLYTHEELEDELGQEYTFLASIAQTWVEVYNRT